MCILGAMQTLLPAELVASRRTSARTRMSRMQLLAGPWTYAILLGVYMPLCLWTDARTASVPVQFALGGCTLAFLVGASWFSSPRERMQIGCMVLFATGVEIGASVVWGVYRYHLGNVPLYVPPGHGLIYLFALRWARVPAVVRYAPMLRRAAVILACTWAGMEVTLAPVLWHRSDVAGLMLLPIFLWFMRTPNGLVYSGAFLATSMLELVGTGFGNWTWAASMPIFHIPVGNPPSVIAGGYCVLDCAAGFIAARLPARFWRGRAQTITSDGSGEPV
jgi:hypothetical protein